MNTLNIFYIRADTWRPMFTWRRSGSALMALVGLMLLIFPLAACDPSTAVPFSDLQLDIPPDALKAPVVRLVPDSQKLHVGVTLKMNQDWLKKMEGTRIEPGKPSHLEDFAKKVGIDDQTYQKFKDFF